MASRFPFGHCLRLRLTSVDSLLCTSGVEACRRTVGGNLTRNVFRSTQPTKTYTNGFEAVDANEFISTATRVEVGNTPVDN